MLTGSLAEPISVAQLEGARRARYTKVLHLVVQSKGLATVPHIFTSLG